MTQKAIVKAIQDDGTVLVSLLRQMECGLSCDSCEGCAQKPTDELLATADPSVIEVQPGALVEVRPNTPGAGIVSLLVFVFPCLGFIVGYLLAKMIGFGDGLSVLLSFVGAAVCFLPALLYNAVVVKHGTPEFIVVRILR